MSNIFSNAKAVKNEKVEEDFLGGGRALETDIYPAKVKYAYIGKAQNSDARNLTLCLVVNKQEISRSIWMTNRNGDVTYKDKTSGEAKNLPGYNQVNALCMLIAGKEVGDLDVEEKTLNLYDFDAKREKPTSVQCFVELHDEELQVAIQKQIIDKTQQDDSGNYVPTGETREVNEFIKFFPAERLVTLSEVSHFIESLGGDFEEVLADGDLLKAIGRMEDDGQYATKWLERNRGETYDRSTKKEGKSFAKSSEGGTEKKSAKSGLFDD